MACLESYNIQSVNALRQQLTLVTPSTCSARGTHSRQQRSRVDINHPQCTFALLFSAMVRNRPVNVETGIFGRVSTVEHQLQRLEKRVNEIHKDGSLYDDMRQLDQEFKTNTRSLLADLSRDHNILMGKWEEARARQEASVCKHEAQLDTYAKEIWQTFQKECIIQHDWLRGIYKDIKGNADVLQQNLNTLETQVKKSVNETASTLHALQDKLLSQEELSRKAQSLEDDTTLLKERLCLLEAKTHRTPEVRACLVGSRSETDLLRHVHERGRSMTRSDLRAVTRSLSREHGQAAVLSCVTLAQGYAATRSSRNAGHPGEAETHPG